MRPAVVESIRLYQAAGPLQHPAVQQCVETQLATMRIYTMFLLFTAAAICCQWPTGLCACHQASSPDDVASIFFASFSRASSRFVFFKAIRIFFSSCKI